MSKVLLVALPTKDKSRIEEYFHSVGVSCDYLPSIDAALERIPLDPPSLVVVEDPQLLEPLGGLQSTLKNHAPTTAFVVTTRATQAAKSIELMRAGAYDCVNRPYDKLQILAASKRAALSKGRTLFVAKVEPPKKYWGSIVAGMVAAALIFAYVHVRRNGPPEYVQNLGAATLSGLQWDGRSLWVGNWYDSTVTHHVAQKSFFMKMRKFHTGGIYRMQDSQPILVCNTPEALITVGFDLKLRSHQRAVGLPTLVVKPAPGSNPTGLAWDGSHLWSLDGQTGLLYKHGVDLQVLESVKSLLPQPSGLAFDGESFWVVGGSPLRLARLTIKTEGVVWQGPYSIPNILPAGVSPSGISAGFNRLWWISGGDPRMMSKSFEELTRYPVGWEKKGAPHAN